MTATLIDKLLHSPIPFFADECLYIDIFSTDKKYLIQYLVLVISSPTYSIKTVDVKAPILQLIHFFPRTKLSYYDNEKYLNSVTVKLILPNNVNIELANAPAMHIQWSSAKIPQPLAGNC